MHCLACNVILDDKEQLRKYKNHQTILNPEDRYINLCTHCIQDGQIEVDGVEPYVHTMETMNDNVFILHKFK